MAVPLFRRLPTLARSFACTSYSQATSATSSGRGYIRKTAVPATASRSASASSPIQSPPSSIPLSSSSDSIDFDDIDNSVHGFDEPSSYSTMQSNLDPIASPPLTTYPTSSYKSLPSVSMDGQTDWGTSFSGMSSTAFSPEARDILLKEVDVQDVECKPGKLFLCIIFRYRGVSLCLVELIQYL